MMNEEFLDFRTRTIKETREEYGDRGVILNVIDGDSSLKYIGVWSKNDDEKVWMFFYYALLVWWNNIYI